MSTHALGYQMARAQQVSGRYRRRAHLVPPATNNPPPDPGNWSPNVQWDDPNPPYDGVQGRYPASVNPPPAGYPTPFTTGYVGAGLTIDDLSAPADNTTITVDGTVLEDFNIQGKLTIDANNVTVRRGLVQGGNPHAFHVRSGTTGTVVEYVRIIGEGPNCSNAFHNQGEATVRFCHASGGADGYKPGQRITLEDSYYAGSYRISGNAGSGSGTHNDAIQIVTGDGYRIRRNTIYGPWQFSTSALLAQSELGPINDLIIEDNYFSGGNYCIWTNDHNSGAFPFTNSQVLNNVCELNSYNLGPKAGTATVVSTGNQTWDPATDTYAPI